MRIAIYLQGGLYMCVGVLLQGFGYLELPPLDSLSNVWYLLV